MAAEKVVIGDATLYHGDCREILPGLGKFDAVVTDPPYGKVKGDFDEEWTTRAGMLADVDGWIDAIVPRMKANATLWWFAWPSLAGKIETRISERLNTLAHIVWVKPTATGQKCSKEALRAPMPVTERLLMAEHYGADNMALGEPGYEAKCDELRGFVFEPLRAYLAGERDRAGWTTRRVAEAYQLKSGSRTVTGMAGHWFERVQWTLPTAENYAWLRGLFAGNYLRREYEDLRREYEDLRREYEDLRRHFDCRNGDQYSDVWLFDASLTNHGHPTEKPVRLMSYIIRLSVRKGGSVVDPFMGSGTTGVACAQLGKTFTGIERERKYFDIACERIARAYAQPRLFEEPPAPKPKQIGLLDDYDLTDRRIEAAA